MGWKDVSLAEVSPTFEVLPQAEYTLEVVGASYREDKNQAGFVDISMRVAVAAGDYQGRTLFVDYPDPERVSKAGKPFDWSKQALKRLEHALGIEQTPGEDLVDMLNRARGLHFVAPVEVQVSKPDEHSEEIKRNRVALFKVRPAA